MNSNTAIDPSELKKKLEYEEKCQKAAEVALKEGVSRVDRSRTVLTLGYLYSKLQRSTSAGSAG